MEYSSSLVGYCSADPRVLPTPARRWNEPFRLLLRHPFSPQSRFFTMPHRLTIDKGIEPRRPPRKKPKTCWSLFSNVRATPSLDTSAAGRFRIVKDDCLAVTIASTM